jgi:hypothetical protein
MKDNIEAAVEAYRNKTPDSITVFRNLTDEEAAVVVRVLRMTARPRSKTLLPADVIAVGA